MNKLSYLRNEEYKRISKLFINGEILDLGGSNRIKDGYQYLIGGNHKISTVNIDQKYGCDKIFDIEKEFPLESNSFDGILCFNVLEHIYSFKNVVSESYRVLKNDGSFFIITPFMHHIHACPDDYFRYSKSCLERMLLEVGYKDIKIEEIGTGLFCLIFQSIDGVILKKINVLRILLMKLFISIDKLLSMLSSRYSKLANRIPLAYFISSKK